MIARMSVGSALLLPALVLAGPALGPPAPDEPVEVSPIAVAEATLQPMTPQAEPTDYYAARPKIDDAVTVDEAVALAMEHSPVLVAAEQDVERARQMMNAVRARLAPRLSTSSWATYGDNPMMMASPPGVDPAGRKMVPAGPSWDTNFMLLYPLTTGGRLEHRVDSAKAMIAANEAAREAMRLDIAFAVRSLGWKLLFDQALTDVRRAELDALQERLRIDQAKFDEGKIPEYYLHRDKAEVARSQQRLTNQQRDSNIDLADLRTVVGLHPVSDLTIEDDFVMPPLAPELNADLATAAGQRPELDAARQKIAAAYHDEKSANAEFLPRVDLVGMANLMANRGNRWEDYVAGLSVGLPLFDGGERLADVREARARRGGLTAEEADLLLQVGRQVTVAHENLTAARQNIDVALLGQVSADEDFRVVTARFDAGKAINIELLDALEAKVQADTDLAEARYRLALAESERRRAIGDASLAAAPEM